MELDSLRFFGGSIDTSKCYIFLTGYLDSKFNFSNICNNYGAQLDLETKFQQLGITQLTRISKKILKNTFYDKCEYEQLKAVDNYGIEKTTPYETIIEPALNSWKLPETGFLMVSLPELENR